MLGGQHRGNARNDHARQVKLARNIGDVQTGGTTERQQREATRVDPATHRNQADTLRHVGVDHAVDALGGSDAVYFQRHRDPIERGVCGISVECCAATQEVRGIEIAEHEVGVCHSRLSTPSTVAGRAWHGAGALRADMQDAAGIDAANRSTAGTETDDVQAVQCQPMATDASAADQCRLTIHDKANVGAGASHVEGDQVVAVEQLGGVAAAGDATGWPGQHATGGETGGIDILFMGSGSASFPRDDGEAVVMGAGDTLTCSQGLVGDPFDCSPDMRLVKFFIAARTQLLRERTPDEIARLEALGPDIITRREVRPEGDTRPVNFLRDA